MTLKKMILWMSLALGLVFQLSGMSLQAQSEEKFKARLSLVPPLAPLQAANVVGVGSATATLAGKTRR